MQTFTQEQSKKIYQDANAKGLDAKKVIYLMAKDGAVFDGVDMDGILSYGQKNYEPKPKEPGIISKIGTALRERGENIKDIGQLRSEGKTGVGELISSISPEIGERVNKFTTENPKIVKAANALLPDVAVAGQVAGGVQDVIGEGISALTPDSVKKFGEEKVKQLVATEFGKLGIDSMEKYNQWATENPLLAKNVEGFANIGLTAADLVGAGEVASGTVNLAKNTGKVVGDIAQSTANSARAVTEPISAVAESVGSTIKSAARRGKDSLVEGVQEAKRVSSLPDVEKVASRSGLDQGVVDFVKTSSKSNIPVYEKIINASKVGAGSLRNGTAAKKVVGKELIDKVVTPAIKLRDKVGSKVGAIVQKLPNTKQDIRSFVDEFTQVLQNVGVTVGNKGKLVAGQGAVVGDLPAYQNMFNRIKAGAASQKDLHEIRSAVFKEFNLAKARQQAFSDTADRVAEQFRSILGKGISDKNYLKYSKDYADIMNKLTDFVKYTGHKGDIANLTAKDLRLAEIAQRTLGNASSRPQEVLDAIVSLADKSGKKGLGKDLADAIRFSDLMEDFYGIQQTRSMAGQVARGTKAGVEGATEALVEGASQGGITGVLGKAVKGILGKTPAEQQRALESLIKSLKK